MDTNEKPTDTAFNLRKIFGDHLTIVIPDMQRDYCWGTKEDVAAGAVDKVTVFLLSIMHLYQTRTRSTLGLLYGYEYPAATNHIMIIDGQQRLTTLYLLIGMLYRRTPREDLRRLLISDYELIDDREPRLLYQVRSEALYFMSDLVTHFFLDRNGRLSQLEQSRWYCATYNSDPTVQSFISALRSIDRVIEQLADHVEIDYDELANFIVDDLVLYYHDLGSRSTAEDMFITINTTGEPLTMPQNYKSILIELSHDAASAISKWEEMEQWAWEHRPKLAAGRTTTSDARLESLMRIWDVYCDHDRIKAFSPANFVRLYRFYGAYRTLITAKPNLIDYDASQEEDMFVVLPTVHYIMKWRLTESDANNIRDIAAYFINLNRYNRVTQTGNDTKTAIAMIDKMPQPDLPSLLDIRAPIPEKILPCEERAKLSFLRAATKRARAKRLLRRAESHPLLWGNVRQVLKWSADKRSGEVDLDRVAFYIDGICKLWGSDIDRRADLDSLRIALLTMRHQGYPIARRGDTAYSLCWRAYDWQRLMSTSPGLIRQAVERLCGSGRMPEDLKRETAVRFSDRNHPFFFLIKNPAYLGECAHRALMRPCESFIGYHKKEKPGRVRGSDTRWFVEQRPLKIESDKWGDIRAYGARCLYTDHREKDVTVAIIRERECGAVYRIEVFRRDEEDLRGRVADSLGDQYPWLPREMEYDKKRHRYYIKATESKNVVESFCSLCGKLGG